MVIGSSVDRSSDVGDKVGVGFTRHSRYFLLTLHTEYRSPVLSLQVAIRYPFATGDSAGVRGTRRETENGFQMLGECQTMSPFGLVKHGYRVCESVGFSP